MFHTQQSWLLSRTQEVTRSIEDRSRATLAYEAPWYDIERRWMPIRQGDAEGCRYDELDEVDQNEAAFEAIINQDMEAEN